MNKQFFGRGVSGGISRRGVFGETFGRVSRHGVFGEGSGQGNLNKVSNMIPDRFSAAGFTPFGHICVRMSPQFFTRGWHRGVIPCVLVVVFILLGVFFMQEVKAQEIPTPGLARLGDQDDGTPFVSRYDTGESPSDNITNLSVRSRNSLGAMVERITVTLVLALELDASYEPPDGTAFLEWLLTKPDETTKLRRTGIFSGETRFSASPSAGLFSLTDDLVDDGSYQLQSRYVDSDENSGAWSPAYTFIVDRVDPSLALFISSSNSAIARIAAATASDTVGIAAVGIMVADNVTASNCTADNIGEVTFTSYNGGAHTVAASQQSCFRVADRAGNVTYLSTANATVDSVGPTVDIRTSSDVVAERRFIATTATDAADQVDKITVADDVSKANCDSSATFVAYDFGVQHEVEATTQDCFRATDRVGNHTYLSTEDATVLGTTDSDFTNNNYVSFISYLDADDLTLGSSNFFDSGTIFINSITVPGVGYRIFLRQEGSSWPVESAPSIRTANSTGQANEGPHHLNDGTYEVAYQVRPAGNTLFQPPYASLAALSTFTIDTTDPIITVTKVSGGSDSEERIYTATVTDANPHRLFVVTGVEAEDCSVITDIESIDSTPVNRNGTTHVVAADSNSCFIAFDMAGNISAESTAISGIASIFYRTDGNRIATNNQLSTRTFTVHGTTTPSTEYRLFVRAKDGTWPGTATASGTSASSDGSITSSNITLNADGDYELATQIKVGSEYLPGTLAVNSEFTIDTTAPTISSPALVSDNSNDTSLAMEGDDLTLTFTVSETLARAPSVTIAGQTVTATESSGTYSATVTVSSSTNEGAVTYDIGVLTDTAGNTNNPDEATTSVLVDRTNPTLTIVQTAGTGTAERTVTAFASDTNGIDSFEIADDESTCTSSVSASSFNGYTQNTPVTVQATTQDCFRATDNAGNTTYVSTANAIAGVGSVSYTNNDNTAAKTGNLLKTNTFTITGTTATNTNYRLFIRERGARIANTWPSYVASGTSAANGTLSQTLTRTDGDYETAFQIQVGNSFVPALASLVATSTFSIDSSPPTFTLAPHRSGTLVDNTAYYRTTGLSTGGVTVSNIVEENLATAVLTLARTDTTGIPNLTPTPTVNTDTNTVSFANLIVVADGTYTATVALTDDAGNQTTKTLNLVVDTATPSITAVTIDTPSARRSVEALITVTHGQTFQETLTATLSGQNCTTLNPITLTGSTTSTTAIQLRGRTGTFTCTITLTDQAGNTSSSFTIPSFTIKRSSSGGGGGVRPGSRVEAPSFNVPVASVTPTQPTDRQERIALLKLALNRILERIQYLLAQKTNG